MEDLDWNVKPVLSPSSTQSVANWAPTWFLFVSLIFSLPITLMVALFPLASIFSPTLLETCIQILKILPLGASVLVGYSLVVLFLWSASSILSLYINLDVNLHDTAYIFSPHLLPLDRIMNGLVLRHQYHQSHISHIQLDRFCCLVGMVSLFTIFISPPVGQTVPLCKSLIPNFMNLSYMNCSGLWLDNYLWHPARAIPTLIVPSYTTPAIYFNEWLS